MTCLPFLSFHSCQISLDALELKFCRTQALRILFLRKNQMKYRRIHLFLCHVHSTVWKKEQISGRRKKLYFFYK